MKNILIYINDSLGELDWIAPFLRSDEGKKFNFYIFLNGPGEKYEDKKNILQQYNLVEENIFLLNKSGMLDRYLFQVDNFFNKVLARIKLYSYKVFKISRFFVDTMRYAIAHIYPLNKDIVFHYIFRDYNLKDSTVLNAYIINSKAKIIVYPHAVGLQRKHTECPREAQKEIEADLWLENSDLSDIAKESDCYKNIFFASGVPAFDINYKKPSLFDFNVKRALIITRDCGMTFGFNYEDAFSAFEKLLDRLDKMDFKIAVKHHPRDNRLKEWRAIQSKYSNASELSRSLNDIDELYTTCFTLFSTAPLFLLSRQIPIFEFSPYKAFEDYNKKMPMHYPSKSKKLTHDLLEFELYKRADDLSKIDTYMNENYLYSLSSSQYKKCQDIFPSGANSKIANKILELNDD